jgi:hypothetical protein
MKIMMVAVFSETSTNCSQAKGFENNGCKVIRYDYRNRAYKIGLRARDKEIVSIVLNDRPEIVFFSKCNDVNISVVKDCNRVSKTVLWYMDPFNRQFGDPLREKIKTCKFTFCALTEPYRVAKSISHNSVYFLQEGFDEDCNYPMSIPYINDVSFIGNLRSETRKKYCDMLGFKVYNNMYAELHSRAVSESKINLNFTEGGTSDRTYKILASKGFLLTQPWESMEDDFGVGKDLDIFTSVDELRSKIDYYLKNEEERIGIAENGYRTVQKFSRTNFAKMVLEIIQ